MKVPSKTVKFSLPANVRQATTRMRRIIREQVLPAPHPWKGAVLLLSGPASLFEAVTHVVLKKVPQAASCALLQTANISTALAHDLTSPVGKYVGKLFSQDVRRVNDCRELEKEIRRHIQEVQLHPRPRILVCGDALKSFYDERISLEEARRALRSILDLSKSAARQGITVIFVQSAPVRPPRAREHFLPWFRLSSDLTVDFQPSAA